MKRRLITVFFVISLLFTSSSADVKFRNINDMHGISIRETASICKDNNGFIWTSSKTGILRIAGNDCRIYQLAYRGTDIYRVNLVYRDRVLLAYTNNGQVFRYNAVYDRFDFLFFMGQILDNRHLVVTSLLIQNQNSFLIASGMGLHKYHEDELSLAGNDASGIQYAVWYDADHVLLAKEKAILLMNIHTLESKTVYENTNPPALRISTLYYDTLDNKLWAGTVSEGLFHFDFNTGAFVRFPVRSFPRQPVRVITANSDSTLLVGVDGQGIWEVNKKGDRVLNVYKENPDNPFSLSGNGIYDIFRDRERVWVCIYSCLDVQSGKWKTCYHNRQEQAQVFLSLCEDGQGRIWAGAYSSGVYVIDGKTGKESAHYSQENPDSPLTSNFIFDIFRDSDGNIWIGSITGNVICYVSKEGRFKTYPVAPVYAFAEWSSDRILMACTFGLCLLDKRTKKMEKVLFGYTLQDILVLNDDVWMCTSPMFPSTGTRIANFATDSWRGGRTGAPYFSTRLHCSSPNRKDGFISRISLCREVRYAIIPPANHRMLTYTNLPNGKYTLKIRMYDDSLSHLLDERQLSIRITPPFWETAWFGLLVALLAGGVIYWTLRLYINRLKQRYARLAPYNELSDRFVKKATEVVRANMSNSEFRKDDFASAMNVSAPLLYKKIKSFTSLAPVDFIKVIRLNHAFELLQSHRYTVTEVSELCGFASAGYFGRVFKRHFGKIPTEI